MVLLLSYRDCGRAHTTEVVYGDDMREEFRQDCRNFTKRLRDERSGRVRDDSPILQDVLIIKN